MFHILFFSCLEKLASVYFKCQEQEKFLGRILMVLLRRKDVFICVNLAMAYMDGLSYIVNMPLFIVNMCRKHVEKNHAWFYYFNEPLKLSQERMTNVDMKVEQESPADVNTISSLSKNCYFSEALYQWLISSAGGGRSQNHADQVLS